MSPYLFGKYVQEKQAIEVMRGGIGSRALASTLGHLGAFPTMTLLNPQSHVNPTDWVGAGEGLSSLVSPTPSKKDTRAEALTQVAKRMESAGKQELGGHRVYLGGPDLFREYYRLYTNPRTSILGKLLGTPTLPLQALSSNLSRGSMYNPLTDSSYIYGNDPAVLTHELGHALDFNSRKVPKADKKKNWLQNTTTAELSALPRDLYSLRRSVPHIGPYLALDEEWKANDKSHKALLKAYKTNPKALNELLSYRQRVLPAGFGSYVGGSLGGPVGAMAGLAAGKVYGVGEDMQRGGKYVAESRRERTETKKDKKDKDDKKTEKQSHEKQAIPVFGGHQYSFAPSGAGVGVEAGYGHVGGVVPMPYVGLDIGTPHTGVSLGGPLPRLGFRSGLYTRPPGITSNPEPSKSLWGWLAQRGKTDEQIEEEDFLNNAARFRGLDPARVADEMQRFDQWATLSKAKRLATAKLLVEAGKQYEKQSASSARQFGKQAAKKILKVLPSWGGQKWQLGEWGLNPQVGYRYLGGVVPTPDLGLRVGSPVGGLALGLDPLPYVEADWGRPSGRHANKDGRSLYQWLGDKAQNRQTALTNSLMNMPQNAEADDYESVLRSHGVGYSSRELQRMAAQLARKPNWVPTIREDEEERPAPAEKPKEKAAARKAVNAGPMNPVERMARMAVRKYMDKILPPLPAATPATTAASKFTAPIMQ